MIVSELSSYLACQPANTKDNPYYIALKIDNEVEFETLKTTLNGAADKYVYLDLSGSTITTIPYLAFSGIIIDYPTLTGIIIPEGVIAIGENAFAGCASLKNITMPSSLTSFGFGALQKCTDLKSITISDSVKSIGDFTFWGCSSLENITIPDSVTGIGVNAFGACINLTTINIADGNTAYISKDGVLYNKGKTILIQYPAGKVDISFSIPDGVTNIEDSAFYGCTRLESIIIPDSITGIGDGAFEGCISLESVTFEGKIPLSGFTIAEFIGDLRDKFYATDAINGTPGKYTTTAPVDYSSVWTKQ
jgi:hypothetical protein